MATFTVEIISEGDVDEATCVQLVHDHTRILCDVGITTRSGSASHVIPDDEPALVLISHGHLGHGGGLLAAHDRWPNTPFYAAAPTFRLLDAQFCHHSNDLRAARQHTILTHASIKEIPFLQTFSPINDVSICLYPCGHICGAAVPLIDWDGCRIAYFADWTPTDFGGNRGLALSELLGCHLLIVQLSNSTSVEAVAARPLDALLSLPLRDALVAVQPLGVLQELLLPLTPYILREWTLHIDAFSFALSQIAIQQWLEAYRGAIHASENWVTLNSGQQRNLYLCGSASLWPGSPSYIITRAFISRTDTLIVLGNDIIPGSPADWLLHSRRLPTANAPLGWEMPRCHIAQISMKPRKLAPQEIIMLIEPLHSEHLVVFGKDQWVSSSSSLSPIHLQQGEGLALQL